MTPDKRVEEIVEQFFRIQNSIWETTTKIELAKRQERELLRTTLTNYHQDLMSEVVEVLNEALLTKAQYAELARGWGKEGSDRYEGYIQGALDVNTRVIWACAGKKIVLDMGVVEPTTEAQNIIKSK